MVLFLVACGQGTTGDVASSSRRSGPPATASQANTTTPSPAPMSTKWNCGDTHNGATAVVIYRVATTSPFVELLDWANPLKPNVACTLGPSARARSLSLSHGALSSA